MSYLANNTSEGGSEREKERDPFREKRERKEREKPVMTNLREREKEHFEGTFQIERPDREKVIEMSSFS